MLNSPPARLTRHLLLPVALALAVQVASPGWAAAPALFDSAFASFSQARAGQDAAAAQAADAFAALLKAEPTNPVLMAYTGAATAMRANSTWLPWQKMTYAEDGLALLDKALALLTPAHNAPLQHAVPAVLEVRFVAAATFLAVPGFMNRGERGAKLLAEVLASPLLGSAPLAFRGDVWLTAADDAARNQRSAQARQYLGEIIKTGAPQATAARAKLAGLA